MKLGGMVETAKTIIDICGKVEQYVFGEYVKRSQCRDAIAVLIRPVINEDDEALFAEIN